VNIDGLFKVFKETRSLPLHILAVRKILSSNLSDFLQSGYFYSVSSTKILYALLMSYVLHVSPSVPILVVRFNIL
jgi:hypothetical protein